MLAALVLLALVGLVVWLQAGEPALAGLEQPERALALVVGRTLDVQTALADAPAWERRLYALTLSDTEDEMDQAIAWYEELAARSLAPGVDLRLAILLGEAGRRAELVRVVSGWPARGDPLAGYAAAIAVAYLEAPRPDPDVLSATLDALGPGWFADALALRLAARLDEPAVAGAARRAIEARASPLLARLRALAALDLLVVGLGLAAAVPLLRRRAPPRAVSEARLPPPWTLGAGLAVLVRGGALGALLLLVLLVGAPWLTADPALMGALDQPAMYLPVLLLARRALLAPAGLGVREAFGLRLRPGGARAAARATLALLAAGILLDLALSLLGERLGFTVHWAEWFDPDLAWGPAAAVAVTVSGSVLFAPVFEELTFRGLLYGSLRARLAWPAAAALSALIFGAAHGYGLAGFLSVLASGILWAWVYERTGSLLPAIAAHVVNNAAVAATLLTLLR